MDEADMSQLLDTLPKHLNRLMNSLKKITLIDEWEESASAQSAETRIRKLSEAAAEWFAETYPDLDPGEPFVPETISLR